MPKKCNKTSTPAQILEGVDVSGKVIFITGATSGIGQETARILALKGATIVIASRDSISAGAFIETLTNEKPDVNIEFLELDLAELLTVQECAENFLAKHSALHCLILNAAVYNPLHRVTDDDFESTFQINYMAQAYLVHLLLPALRNGVPSRLVVVSCEHYNGLGGKLPVGKVTWRHLSPTHKLYFNSAPYAYGLSKLCMILFSNEFNRSYACQGIISNAVDPGTCKHTKLYENSKFASIYFKLRHPFRTRPERGAANLIYCACCPDLISKGGGKFYRNLREVQMPSRASNPQVAKLLCSRTEFMIHMHFERLERKAKRRETDRVRWARMTL